jgi:exonuclease SbcC
MRLKKIELENFLVFESLEYTFGDKPILVQGLNLTDDGQESNGVGKSALFTAIEFCITASNSRGTKDSELVMHGEKTSRLQLYAECDVRKEEICIDWTVKVRGSNTVSISIKKNGVWEESSFSNVNDAKKFIMNWFAISKDDLFNYFLISNNKFKSFYKSSNREKVDLINRFSDASIVDGIEEVDTSNLEGDIMNANRKVIGVNAKIELLDSQIEELKTVDHSIEFDLEQDRLDGEIESSERCIQEEILEIQKTPDKIKVKEADISKYKRRIADLEILSKKAFERHLEKENDIDENLNNPLNVGLIEEYNNLKEPNFEAETSKLSKQRNDASTEIAKHNASLKELHKKEVKLNSILIDLESKVGGAISCPSCSHEFTINSDKSLEELKADFELHKSYVPKLTKKKTDIYVLMSEQEEIIAQCKDRNSDISQELNDFRSEKLNLSIRVNMFNEFIGDMQKDSNELKLDSKNYISEIKSLEFQIGNVENDIEHLKNYDTIAQSAIDSMQRTIDALKDEKRSLEKGSSKSDIDLLEDKKKSLQEELEPLAKELETLNDELNSVNQWKVRFKEFRMHLANQSLDIIQYHNNRYLEEMGSDMRVSMEGYKKLANGTYKEEITANIIRNGVERTFSSFSGGEKGRLLFASILANRFMINSTHPYGGLDFLTIDEIFEGVDGIGLTTLIDSAKKMEVAVMMVTHALNREADSDVMTVVKENGTSKVIRNIKEFLN